MMPFPICGRCFPAEKVYPISASKVCLYCAYGIRGKEHFFLFNFSPIFLFFNFNFFYGLVFCGPIVFKLVIVILGP